MTAAMTGSAEMTSTSDMVELERLLSNAVTVKTNRPPGREVSEVLIARCDIAPKTQWSLSFCPDDGCFFVAIDGHERLRTDSPQIACVYFTARRPH